MIELAMLALVVIVVTFVLPPLNYLMFLDSISMAWDGFCGAKLPKLL